MNLTLLGNQRVPRAFMAAIALLLMFAGCSERPIPTGEDALPTAAAPAPAPEVDAFGMALLTESEIAALKERALAGDAMAMTLVIDTFTLGIGVPEDEVEVYRLAEKGAEMGMIDAKAALGRALRLNSSGIPHDDARGLTLLEEAAAQGNERAVRILSYELTPAEREKRLITFDREYGLKDGVTAIVIAGACYELSREEKAATEEVGRAMECIRTWLTRAESAERNPQRAEAAAHRGELAEFAETKSLPGYGDIGPLVKQISDLTAASRREAYYIAYASAVRAERAASGKGFAQNAEEARTYALKATSIEGLIDSSQSKGLLGSAYVVLWNLHVEGTDTGYFPDNRRAYGWALLNKSVTDAKAWDESGNELPFRNLEKGLSLEQRLQVQAAVAARKPGEDLNLPDADAGVASTAAKTSQGTAFLISDDGFALTNAHVVKQCKAIKDSAGTVGVVVAQDEANDLAAIRFGSYTGKDFARIEASSKLPRVGDRVAVFGFPLSEVLATTGNLTAGEVSAMAGLGNNSSMFQISAPIQPGSSGSPVLSLRGNVAGIISSTASTVRLTQATGAIAQNLNFAINKDTVVGFLRANGIPFEEAGDGIFSSGDQDVAAVGEQAQKWTIRVTCEN